MTIRDIEKYTEALWDWGFLDDCFQLPNGKDSKCRVSDQDGITERFGEFLVIECKRPNLEKEKPEERYDCPKGQMRMFSAMAKQKGFSVLLVWGEKNAPVQMRYHLPYAKEWCRRRAFDATKMHAFVTDWFQWANSERGARDSGNCIIHPFFGHGEIVREVTATGEDGPKPSIEILFDVIGRKILRRDTKGLVLPSRDRR